MDEHEPKLEANMAMWDAALGDTPSSATAAKLAATMANAERKSGCAVPLTYNEAVFLEKPNVSGA